jgi:hypothetical protein
LDDLKAREYRKYKRRAAATNHTHFFKLLTIRDLRGFHRLDDCACSAAGTPACVLSAQAIAAFPLAIFAF